MTLEELEAEIRSVLDYQDSGVGALDGFMQGLQDYVYAMLLLRVLGFDTSGGKVVAGKAFNRQVNEIEQEILKVLSTEAYKIEVDRYLRSQQILKDRIIRTHEGYNTTAKIPFAKIDPVILQIQSLTSNSLSVRKGVQSNYIDPLKMLLVQQATTGQTVDKMLTMLKAWHDGDLANGKNVLYSVPTPSLTHYVHNTALDAGTLVMRTTNEVIKQENEMNGFAYVGGIIEDTRPFCRFVVSQHRQFYFTEVPKLIRQYPQGLYPNTTKENFCQNCGGYNCRHMAFPVIVDEDVE